MTRDGITQMDWLWRCSPKRVLLVKQSELRRRLGWPWDRPHHSDGCFLLEPDGEPVAMLDDHEALPAGRVAFSSPSCGLHNGKVVFDKFPGLWDTSQQA